MMLTSTLPVQPKVKSPDIAMIGPISRHRSGSVDRSLAERRVAFQHEVVAVAHLRDQARRGWIGTAQSRVSRKCSSDSAAIAVARIRFTRQNGVSGLTLTQAWLKRRLMMRMPTP